MYLIFIANIAFIYFYIKNYFNNNLVETRKNILSFFLHILLSSIYVLIFINFDSSLEILYLWTISTILILIMFTDLVDMVIPDNLILLIIIISFLYRIMNHHLYNIGADFLFYISGCVLATLIFIIIFLISKGGIGQGDITLIGALGFILGPYLVMLNIFLSFLIGSIVSTFLLVFGIKTYKDPIPFGPFIIIGFYISTLCGSQIISWYINLL